MKTKVVKVYVRYTGEEPTNARLFGGGAKVAFKKGTVRAAQLTRASSLSRAHKGFEIVDVTELSANEIKDAKDFEAAIEEHIEKVQKEMEREAKEAKKEMRKNKKEIVKEENSKEDVNVDGLDELVEGKEV